MIDAPPLTKCGNTLRECMDPHNYTRRHIRGKIMTNYEAHMNRQFLRPTTKSPIKNKYNAKRYQPKSFRISHHHKSANKHTNYFLRYHHYPLLVPPHPHPSCRFGTSGWNTTRKSWVNLFVRLSIQEILQEVLLIMWTIILQDLFILHSLLPSTSPHSHPIAT